MIINKWNIISLLSIILLSGCATQSQLYYWGEYESLIYASYIKPGSADPQTQIEKLNTTLQRAESLGKKIAPGIYAHLGFLYAAQGREAESMSAFIEERTLYPESAIFINGMLKRAKENKEKSE